MSTREDREADAAADRFVDDCHDNHLDPQDCRYCAQREMELACDDCGCEVVIEVVVDGSIRVTSTQLTHAAFFGAGVVYRHACPNDNHGNVVDGFSRIIYLRNVDSDGEEIEGWTVA